MSFFRRIFANAPPLERVGRAVDHKRWAEVLNLANSIDRSQLDEYQREELEGYLLIAGDALAAINLDEGEAWARQGDRSRALEHLRLARSQVYGQTLKSAIDAALEKFSVGGHAIEPMEQSSTACASGCCPPAEESTAISPEAEMDLETRLDLILSGYPEAYAKRYLQLSPSLIEAVLISHDGRLDEALDLFARIKPEHQCETFLFERGSLYARQKKTSLALADLQETLRRQPQHLLALESMADLFLASGDSVAAQQLMASNSASMLSAAFKHARQARSFMMQDNQAEALNHARQAIDHGSRDSDTLVLAATLYEKNADYDRAEQVLQLLGGGGCSGGQNLLLAEFRFRHGRDLAKALETYKALSRSEPAHAAWLLRIGQIYLRQGWAKEGKSILETLSASALVGDEIKQVALRELDCLSGQSIQYVPRS
ncbi:MAG: hypothetical protein A2091_11875 [Desulfuromonadales bacterium GWD2_61_12]|nr:MAG: hypothetical protein A2005_07795 [Desulfuromonadales bacterium GWC2_61_20]OGR34743.1 MAG: hypothetical protein A2091_11875 [Desulfuromonadales bacterium GWD2_61_12]